MANLYDNMRKARKKRKKGKKTAGVKSKTYKQMKNKTGPVRKKKATKKRKKGKPIRKTTKGKGANYRKTKSGAGMTRKGIKAYRRANPGSKLKGAVTGKVKKGSKAAKRRKSYCARSAGQKKRSSAKTRNNPNSRINQARRRWKC
jgi:hypothetical protein